MVKIEKILETLENPVYNGNKNMQIKNVVSINDIKNNKEINISWYNDKNLEMLEAIETQSVIIVSKNATSKQTKTAFLSKTQEEVFKKY